MIIVTPRSPLTRNFAGSTPPSRYLARDPAQDRDRTTALPRIRHDCLPRRGAQHAGSGVGSHLARQRPTTGSRLVAAVSPVHGVPVDTGRSPHPAPVPVDPATAGRASSETRPVPRDASAARPPARYPYTELVDTRNWRTGTSRANHPDSLHLLGLAARRPILQSPHRSSRTQGELTRGGAPGRNQSARQPFRKFQHPGLPVFRLINGRRPRRPCGPRPERWVPRPGGCGWPG
jgi:hypothetical protein